MGLLIYILFFVFLFISAFAIAYWMEFSDCQPIMVPTMKEIEAINKTNNNDFMFSLMELRSMGVKKLILGTVLMRIASEHTLFMTNGLEGNWLFDIKLLPDYKNEWTLSETEGASK